MKDPRSLQPRSAPQSVQVGDVEPDELRLTQRTWLVLLLFLEESDRWWTAGAMTTRLGWSGDSIRTIHRLLVDAHWATRVVDGARGGLGRHLVRLTPAGVDCARRFLRASLTPADAIHAAAFNLSIVVVETITISPPAKSAPDRSTREGGGVP
jgi:hypothetical protein